MSNFDNSMSSSVKMVQINALSAHSNYDPNKMIVNNNAVAESAFGGVSEFPKF